MKGVTLQLEHGSGADSSLAIGYWVPTLVKEMHGGAWTIRFCKGTCCTSHDSSTSGKQQNNPILPRPASTAEKIPVRSPGTHVTSAW